MVLKVKTKLSWKVRKNILEGTSHTGKLLNLDSEPLNIEYITAISVYGSFKMIQNLNTLKNDKEFVEWYSKNIQVKKPELYYPKGFKKMQYQTRVKLNKELFKSSPNKLNSKLRKIVAVNGMNSAILPKADTYTDDVIIDKMALTKPFFDTMLLKPLIVKDFENSAKEKIFELQKAFNSELKIKFLPWGHWLINLATLNTLKVSKVLKTLHNYFDVLNCDYTQDFAACIKSNVYDLYSNRNQYYTKNIADNLLALSCNSNLGTLYKGKFKLDGFIYNFKIYDKIHSMMNNTGLNSIGLTAPKTLLAPREVWIKNHTMSQLFKTHSVLRVEVTIPASKLANKTKILNRAIKYAEPLLTMGDVEKWLNSYFLCKRPQIIIDASNLQHSQIEKAASWLYEDDAEDASLHNGKILLAYWIEGDKHDSSLQGLSFTSLDDALQKTLGNRPIIIFKLSNDAEVLEDETIYYGVDSKFKPLPTTSNIWYGRGVNEELPTIINNTFPWTTSHKIINDRSLKVISKSTINKLYMSYKIVDCKSNAKSTNYELPTSLKGLKFADSAMYHNRKTVHKIALYGLVDGKPVIVRDDGRILKTRVMSKIAKPKYYHSHLQKFTLSY